MIKNPKFKTALRKVILSVSKGGPQTAQIEYETVKNFLEAEGMASGCFTKDYKGQENRVPETADEEVLWYAGQYLDIVENEAWFAMNSFINCLDRFCPPDI